MIMLQKSWSNILLLFGEQFILNFYVIIIIMYWLILFQKEI